MNLRRTICLSLSGLLAIAPVSGTVEPVSVSIPDATGWTGQRIPIFVELRSSGSFGGATSFSLPQIPRSILLKVGNPVVSSEQADGATWFVQRHEFAFYSQADGLVELPSFPVRYGTREGFTGPVEEVEGTVPPAQIRIERPPGTEGIGFLVTTDSFTVREIWDPSPEEAVVGSVFKRTIRLLAEDLSGMALPPAPLPELEELRIYRGDPSVIDSLERGEFRGERREPLTYLVLKPGRIEIPPITYAWWNPTARKLEGTTLPGVILTVAEPPALPADTSGGFRPAVWMAILLLLSVVGGAVWKRDWIAVRGRSILRRLNPPDRIARRKLLQACRKGDTRSARHWLFAWQASDPDFRPDASADIREAVDRLYHLLYSRSPGSAWDGHQLARAVLNYWKRSSQTGRTQSELPPLNP